MTGSIPNATETDSDDAAEHESAFGRGPVIAIVGPTAVGKSEVADLVATRLSTEVISADAMQVYRGMSIGTAKARPSELHAPLRCIDLVEPNEVYSAARFQRAARREIDRLLNAGRIPIVCGGTGLYVRAALDEFVFPEGDPETGTRRCYNELAGKLGPSGIHALLAARDPKSARLIHPHNVRRVVRALEMLDKGTSYARQRENLARVNSRYETRCFGLTRERAELYRRIDERVDTMVASGLIDEVRALMDAGAGAALTARQAIGYQEIIEYLQGERTLEDSLAAMRMRTRRYAKRQLSWFGRDKRVEWIIMDGRSASDAANLIIEEART